MATYSERVHAAEKNEIDWADIDDYSDTDEHQWDPDDDDGTVWCSVTRRYVLKDTVR